MVIVSTCQIGNAPSSLKLSILHNMHYLQFWLVEPLEEAEELGHEIHVDDSLNGRVPLKGEQSSEANGGEDLEDVVVLVDELVQLLEVTDLE
jgi:hypothetical protein